MSAVSLYPHSRGAYLFPVDHKDPALLVDIGNISSLHPSIRRHSLCSCFGIFPISFHNIQPPSPYLSSFSLRNFVTALVYEFDLGVRIRFSNSEGIRVVQRMPAKNRAGKPRENVSFYVVARALRLTLSFHSPVSNSFYLVARVSQTRYYSLPPTEQLRSPRKPHCSSRTSSSPAS